MNIMLNQLFKLIIASLFLFSCSKEFEPADDPNSNTTPRSVQSSVSLVSNKPNLKGQNHLQKGVDRYKLLVKFNPEALLDFDDHGKPLFNEAFHLTTSLTKGKIDKINSLHFKQAIPFGKAEKSAMRKGAVLHRHKEHGKFNIYRFKGLAYIKEAEKMTPDEVLALANELEQLDVVEYAVVESDEFIPPPVTPNFMSNQRYRLLYPSGTTSSARGINAEFAWNIGIAGQGIKVADIEYNLNTSHEDLSSPKLKYILGTQGTGSVDHGTAVAGIITAKHNGIGVKGMAYEIDSFLFVQETTLGRAAGIARGMTRLRAGDVFMYEMQTGGASGDSYVPADYNQAVWDITDDASDAGIIVVAAAGNGNVDLDGAAYNSYRSRGDNGAIIVGAGSASRAKASFSTYGTRVNLQAWGDWSVTTTGYGDLYNQVNANYTSSFSGTSSATPIVASAVISVQSWYKLHNAGAVLTPVQMRNLLVATGIAQTSGGHIGPLPNIKAAIDELAGTTSYLVNGGVYKIVSAVNNTSVLYVNSHTPANGTIVSLWAQNNPISNNQKWLLRSVGDGEYVFKSLADTTKVLDVRGGLSANGTQIQVYNFANVPAQKWSLKYVGSNYYNLSPGCALDKNLDVNAGATANGTKIQIWSKNTGNPQKFKLVKL